VDWWKKHESIFPTIDFLTKKILGIVSSQIEIEIIFSLVGVSIDLRRCCLQSNNFEKLIFIRKNWHNYTKVGYKALSRWWKW
jgi:hypothetical protein